MAVIVTRAGKGSPLTNNEVDANFVNINTELGTRAAAGANSDITSLAGITGGISTADYLDIDTAATPTGAVGRMKWSATEAGPEIGMGGGNVTLQLGQEELLYVLNNTGSAFAEMQVVRVTGAQGNRITVALAQANSEINSSSSIAVVTEPIANNAQGFVTRGGLIHDIDTSAFAEGAALWLSPTTAGGITTTKPTAPNHMVLIGWCVRSHATVGQIFVHVQNGYELEELHDVLITSVANGQFLRYDSTAGVWKNQTLDLSGYQPVDADLTAIAALSGTSGFLKKTAADTWTLDTSTYLTTAVTSAVAGTGVSVSAATGAVTFSIGQAVATSSNVQFNSLGVGTAGSAVAGEIRATNNITAYYSDARLKTKVSDIQDPLGRIRQIETMLYRANETAVALGYDASIVEVGVSAQSVQKVQPEAVAPAPIDEQYLTVRYERLVPLLIESIKALEDRLAIAEALVAKMVD